jgi:hypothetical protein
VDARLYFLQTEAGLVTPAELTAVLVDFHREKLTMRQRHVAVARHVSDYNFNNTYQQVISREDVHLSWLEAAIAELGATPAHIDEPDIPAPHKYARVKDVSFIPLVAEDTAAVGDFVARWRPRLAAVTHARHRNMMGVILGETLEQKRFFDQMVAGNEDLLGRRSNGPGSPGTGDGVMGVRWVE